MPAYLFLGAYETNVELPDGTVRLTQPGEIADLDFDDPGPLWRTPTKAEQAKADKAAKAAADQAAADAAKAAAAADEAAAAQLLDDTTPATPATSESEQKS